MHLGRKASESKGWIALREILRLKRLNYRKIQQMRQIIASSSKFGDVEEVGDTIISQRRRLSENSDLQLSLKIFWRVLSAFVEQPSMELSEDGYLEFHIYLQRALLGDQLSEKEMVRLADADYRHDIARFGTLSETTFCDVICELIEMWLGASYGRLMAAFGWSLLRSIVDVEILPPKFRPMYEVTNVTFVVESDLYIKFSADRGVRIHAAAYLDWFDRNEVTVDTLNRLTSRRQGVTLNTKKKDLVFLQYRIDEPNREPQQKANSRVHYVFDGVTGDNDSDDESSEWGCDEDEMDNVFNGRKQSRWTKLHNALKVVRDLEKQKAMEDEEEALRQRSSLVPVKNVYVKGRNRSDGITKKKRNLFSRSSSSIVDGVKKKIPGLSTSLRDGDFTTLLWEGADREETLFHIVSKTKTKPIPFSPLRPFSAKSVVKPDNDGILHSKYALDSNDDGDGDQRCPPNPLKCKQTRSGLFRHNSFGNYTQVSPTERSCSPKKGPLVVRSTSSHFFESPHQKSGTGTVNSTLPRYSCDWQPSFVDISDDDESATATQLVEDFLIALRDAAPDCPNHRSLAPAPTEH